MTIKRGLNIELADKGSLRHKLDETPQDKIIFINNYDYVVYNSHSDFQNKIYVSTCSKFWNNKAECYYCKAFEEGYTKLKLTKRISFFYYSCNQSSFVYLDLGYKKGLDLIKTLNLDNSSNEYLPFSIQKFGTGVSSFIDLKPLPNHKDDKDFMVHYNKLIDNNLIIKDEFIETCLSPIDPVFSLKLLSKAGVDIKKFAPKELLKELEETN